MRARVEAAGLAGEVEIDSCGTAGYHVGEPPDGRSAAAAKEHGYDLSTLRARQLTREDFQRFDYVLAMDHANLGDAEGLRDGSDDATVGLFLSYGDGKSTDEVPDPYYGGPKGFEHVIELCEDAADGLLEDIRGRLGAK